MALRSFEIEDFRLAADVERIFSEEFGRLDAEWAEIEDEPLAPDAQFDEEIT